MLYDREILEPLLIFLEMTYGKAQILEETVIGRSRADILMVRPGSFSRIEIKSDADSYARLSGQAKDYDRYFDFNYIVVGLRHTSHITEHVPESWGVLTANKAGKKVNFSILREATTNENVEPERQMHFLWRSELAHLLVLNGLPKYRQKSKDCTKPLTRPDSGFLFRPFFLIGEHPVPGFLPFLFSCFDSPFFFF